jgi:hypothetical protein
MSKSRQIKLSISILVLGIIMFFIGIDTFTYQGNISKLYSKIGMISFISWLPTIIIGIIMTIVSVNRKEKKHPTIE